LSDASPDHSELYLDKAGRLIVAAVIGSLLLTWGGI
jgi:hypothetical protein